MEIMSTPPPPNVDAHGAPTKFEVSSADGSVFIADGRGSAGDGVYCVPSKHGGCVYYIAVTAGEEDEPAMQLTATADVPTGVSLVRAFCVSRFFLVHLLFPTPICPLPRP